MRLAHPSTTFVRPRHLVPRVREINPRPAARSRLPTREMAAVVSRGAVVRPAARLAPLSDIQTFLRVARYPKRTTKDRASAHPAVERYDIARYHRLIDLPL